MKDGFYILFIIVILSVFALFYVSKRTENPKTSIVFFRDTVYFPRYTKILITQYIPRLEQHDSLPTTIDTSKCNKDSISQMLAEPFGTSDSNSIYTLGVWAYPLSRSIQYELSIRPVTVEAESVFVPYEVTRRDWKEYALMFVGGIIVWEIIR